MRLLSGMTQKLSTGFFLETFQLKDAAVGQRELNTSLLHFLVLVYNSKQFDLQ